MGIIDYNGIEKKLDDKELEKSASELRGYTLIALNCAGSGHSGGSLSAADITSVLFQNVMKHKPSDPDWEDRDRLFFSAGHKAPIWYAALGQAGYFDIKETATLRKLGSKFQGHPDAQKLLGIEMSGGSLGQGLSAAVGSAINAKKIDNKDYRVFCIMGDGEQQEGQIWEAAQEASHYKLDNLVGIVDANRLQIDGNVKEVMNIEPIDEKYAANGWHTINCDGHNIEELLDAFKEAENTKDKPTMIIANTVKGKGVSYMENEAGWHGKAPDDIELTQALKELGQTNLPREEMKIISKLHQERVTIEIDQTTPKFSKNYWWNSEDSMKVDMVPTRKGFGKELAENTNPDIVALGADISGSICIDMFYKDNPKNNDRFFSIGIAEQSGTVVAAGLAKEGKIPIFGTYGVFAAGRALDQIRTTVCYGNLNVKIAGAHGGVSVGPDGATHQALEEIFQISGLPNMTLLVPSDANETRQATREMIAMSGPVYIRYAREATPVVTYMDTPFKLGEATIITYNEVETENFKDAFTHTLSSEYQTINEDISIIACGPEVPEAMRAAYILDQEYGISARVINMSTIKPLDTQAIIDAGQETGAIITAEEHQVGGLGNLVAATIATSEELYKKPVLMDMIGVQDTFGLSGEPWELMKYFGLTAEHIAYKAKEMVDKK